MIEDHLDQIADFGEALVSGNGGAHESLYRYRIHYARQSQPLGLGHAILRAKSFAGREPCAVLLPDDIVDSARSFTEVLMQTHNEHQAWMRYPQ